MTVLSSSLIGEQSGSDRFADQSVNLIPGPLRL